VVDILLKLETNQQGQVSAIVNLTAEVRQVEDLLKAQSGPIRRESAIYECRTGSVCSPQVNSIQLVRRSRNVESRRLSLGSESHQLARTEGFLTTHDLQQPRLFSAVSAAPYLRHNRSAGDMENCIGVLGLLGELEDGLVSGNN